MAAKPSKRGTQPTTMRKAARNEMPKPGDKGDLVTKKSAKKGK